MKKWLLGVSALVVGLLGLTVCEGVFAAERAPSIEEIMKKVNGGKGLQKKQLPDSLKASPVDWPAVQKLTKEYAELAAALGQNDPPKGEKASWAKLTKAYADAAKKLNDAAEKKDKEALLAVHNQIGKSCGGCHKAHKAD
jgi:cytochrome c556